MKRWMIGAALLLECTAIYLPNGRLVLLCCTGNVCVTVDK